MSLLSYILLTPQRIFFTPKETEEEYINRGRSNDDWVNTLRENSEQTQMR